MLNDKYYTPLEEEFHIGFEFEQIKHKRFKKDDQMVDETIWEPKVVHSLNWVTTRGLNHWARVKYLDKEDIESLGFKQIESSFSHDIYEISFSYKIIKDKMSNLENHYFIHFINGYGGKETQIFSGFIKNKSELKVLLKQLGIC